MRRMLLKEYIDIVELKDMVNSGNIKKIMHPELPLVMYNYTKECQANGVWNATTLKCRGLIVNSETNEIVARPYEKFFNYEEYVATNMEYKIPFKEPYKITEKMDGSLGILYWYDDKAYITTKGSFNSIQGEHATNRFRSIMESNNALKQALNRNYTYLFEIIYPDEKMCINYGDIDDLYLHGVININNGEELDIREESERIYRESGYKITTVTEYYGIDWKEIRNIVEGNNKEGFVVRFANGFRLKLKYESYWRIHYFRAGINDKMILAALMEGGIAIEEFKAKMKLYLDEENELMVIKKMEGFQSEFKTIESKVYSEHKVFKKVERDGKTDFPIEGVNYYKSCTYPHLQFALAKGKNITPMIWKMIIKNLKDVKEV